MTKANLGCGDDYRQGWYNVDAREAVRADRNYDLDDCPWPWPDDSFEHALLDNVLEHLENQESVLHELARVVEPHGTIVVRVPHWNSPGAWTNIDHTRPVTHRTFEHYRVPNCLSVVNVDCTRVRFGRALPKMAALWLADHVGHIVSEVEVTLEVGHGE